MKVQQELSYGIIKNDSVLELSGYSLWRGERESDSAFVLVKESPIDKNRKLKSLHEFEVLKSLQTSGIPKAIDLIFDSKKSALIMENGHKLKSLGNLIEKRKLSIPEVLTLASKLGDILGRMHKQGVVHAGLTPWNILLTDTKEIYIIDFSRATLLFSERQDVKNTGSINNSGLDLRYSAPEQSGRMNRSLDWRTDLYSLGIILYRCLTGRLPFESDDMMELMHAHIALKPENPSNIDNEIPQAISDIILKLLNKTAELRYQSGFGLKRDSDECLKIWKSQGNFQGYRIGEKDVSDRFQLPQKLYGREKEVERLMASFEEVENGRSQLLLIKGVSGIGKSSLVQEIQKPIVRSHGYFVQGKFDQFKRDIPYSAFSMAFGHLMRQIAMESSEELSWWKSRFQDALGNIGQVVVDIVPELEMIIGPQANLSQLGTDESQNRFNLAIEKFVKACSSSEHPLVLFIDDLQWADSASLELLKLFCDKSSKHVLIIGAYRDNEVDNSHPFIKTLNDINSNDGIVSNIEVKALYQNDIADLLVDTLGRSDDGIQDLAMVILEKTAGNPFFVGEVLMALYREMVIRFEEEKFRWVWDLAGIDKIKLASSVVELMVDRLNNLDENLQEMLKLAACIGNSFDLHSLSIISATPEWQVSKILWEAAKLGFIIPVGEGYKYVSRNEKGVEDSELKNTDEVHLDHDNSQRIMYQFSHDRVQQAAYSLIPEDKKSLIHVKIGRLILENTAEDDLNEYVFDIVRHFNVGLNLIANVDEKNQIAKLNTLACKRAKSSKAYEAAVRYAEYSKSILGDSPWLEYYDETLETITEGAEAYYLIWNIEKMEEWCDWVETNSKNSIDSAKAIEIKIVGYIGAGRYKEAIDVGTKVLRKLNVKFPEKISLVTALRYIIYTHISTAKKKVNPKNIVMMSDQKIITAMRILIKLMSALYFSNPNGFLVATCFLVNLSYRYGISNESAYGFSIFAMIEVVILKNMKRMKSNRAISQLLMNTLPNRENHGKVSFILDAFVNHNDISLHEIYLASQEIEKLAVENGDLEYASHCLINFKVYMPFLFGIKTIEKTKEHIAEYIEKLNIYKNVLAYDLVGVVSSITDQFSNAEIHSNIIHSVDQRTSKEILSDMDIRSDAIGIAIISGFTIYTNYFFGQYKNSMHSDLKLFQINENALQGFYLHPILYIFSQLLLLSRSMEVDCGYWERKRCIKKAKKKLSIIRGYSKTAPFNYAHLRALVEAELCSATGIELEAEAWYDEAITTAKSNGSINIEGLANERAAAHYMRKEKYRIALAYLKDSVDAYRKWGAYGAILSLHDRYNKILGDYNLNEVKSTTLESNSSEKGNMANDEDYSGSEKSDHSDNAVDLEALSRASQAITGELELKGVLENVMKVVLHSSGASGCALALLNGNELELVAESDNSGSKVVEKAPVESSPRYPGKILNQVARLKEVKLIGNIALDAEVSSIESFSKRNVKSLLCQPIINQGKLIGVVYVENDLAVDAFTNKHTKLLSLLSSQIAISIENARLYENIQSVTAERSRIQTEMELAQKIQTSLLPSGKELELDGYESYGYMKTADEVGGDYYDVIKVYDKQYAVIGDVSGHGVTSGLIMMMAQTSLHTRLNQLNSGDTKEILVDMNKTLFSNIKKLDDFKYMTFQLFELGINGNIRYSGSHLPALIYRNNSKKVEELPNEGFWLGIEKNLDEIMRINEFHMDSGDVLLLYTDGITEAISDTEELFGQDRLGKVLESNAELPLEKISQRILDAISNYNQSDDVTLLILKKK